MQVQRCNIGMHGEGMSAQLYPHAQRILCTMRSWLWLPLLIKWLWLSSYLGVRAMSSTIVRPPQVWSEPSAV